MYVLRSEMKNNLAWKVDHKTKIFVDLVRSVCFHVSRFRRTMNPSENFYEMGCIGKTSRPDLPIKNTRNLGCVTAPTIKEAAQKLFLEYYLPQMKKLAKTVTIDPVTGEEVVTRRRLTPAEKSIELEFMVAGNNKQADGHRNFWFKVSLVYLENPPTDDAPSGFWISSSFGDMRTYTYQLHIGEIVDCMWVDKWKRVI